MKKFFTLIAVAVLAIGAQAQEKVLFTNGEAYGNGATLTSANTKLVLGNDRTSKNYDMKLASVKAYCAELFGQQVMVENSETGEMEEKTRVVYLVGNQNPKDGVLDGDASVGGGYKPDKANLPQSGTYYMITPSVNGRICAFVICNGGKNFYVAKGSDGSCLGVNELTFKADGDEAAEVKINEDYTFDDKMTGTVEFDVVAGETYYVFCTGSKLSFGGYVFTTEGGGPVNPDGPEALNLYIANSWNVNLNAYENVAVVYNSQWGEIQLLSAFNPADYKGYRLEYVADPSTAEAATAEDGSTYYNYIQTKFGSGDGNQWEDLDPNASVKEGDFNEAVKALESSIFNVQAKAAGAKITITKAYLVKNDGSLEQITNNFGGGWGYALAPTPAINVDFQGAWGSFNVVDAAGENVTFKPNTGDKEYVYTFEFAEPISAGVMIELDNNGEGFNWNNLEAGLSKYDLTVSDMTCGQWGDDGLTSKEMTSMVVKANDQGTFPMNLKIAKVTRTLITDGIRDMQSQQQVVNANAPVYNLAGVRVGSEYKGIVIQNGRKFIRK